MISDEVRMLVGRMKSNPEEFIGDNINFGDRYRVREALNWDRLMNSLINDKPDIRVLFTPEEIELLRETAREVLRPVALGTIVKTIVGGEEPKTNLQQLLEAKQATLDYNTTWVPNGGTVTLNNTPLTPLSAEEYAHKLIREKHDN